MNIIFVDVDGPLLPRKMHMFHQNRKSGIENPPQFDQFAVRAFNIWAKYSDAKIVFSTYWAYEYNDDELKDIMTVNGLGFDYHNVVVTPKKMSSQRHNEILWWLAENSNKGDKFIAVDDDSSCQHIESTMTEHMADKIQATGKWIDVDFDNGLSWDNFLDGCEVLGINIDYVYEKEFENEMVKNFRTDKGFDVPTQHLFVSIKKE